MKLNRIDNLNECNVNEIDLRYLDDTMPENVHTIYSNRHALKELLPKIDLLIGAVLVVGAKAPKLIDRELLALMKSGSVLVDVSVDQGGCIETCRPTTHSDPTFLVDGVVHYCVANMPGGVPRTSTFALNQATLPYLVRLANKGYKKALAEDKNFLAGLNVHKGQITYKAVADVFGYNFVNPAEAIRN